MRHVDKIRVDDWFNLKPQRSYYRKLVGTDITNLLYNTEREVHKLKPLRLQLEGQEHTVGEDNN